jgi:hypothetical protein
VTRVRVPRHRHRQRRLDSDERRVVGRVRCAHDHVAAAIDERVEEHERCLGVEVVGVPITGQLFVHVGLSGLAKAVDNAPLNERVDADARPVHDRAHGGELLRYGNAEVLQPLRALVVRVVQTHRNGLVRELRREADDERSLVVGEANDARRRQRPP